MEFQRVEHTANVGVAGHDVNVIGVDRIVVQTDEDTADSPIVVTGTSVAGSFIPGSMKDFRIYVSDTYCVDISIAAVAAAVGFELKFGHIEYLLYNNTLCECG
ncbi:hypothetical protein BgiBS90_027711 [Biomphalaria glabrata]|nr:hypothetical protein BgiBS90_027711 [Biomphalaria glabrata]